MTKEGEPIRMRAASLVNKVVIQKIHPNGDHTEAILSLAKVVADSSEALELVKNPPKDKV